MTRPADVSTATPILHIDLDALHASVAARGRPELRDRPVIVGGGYRGVVLSANSHARACGVRSGMPSTRARRLCPDAFVVPADHDELAAVSAAVLETARRVTPVVEAVSPDEAYLDVSGAIRRLGPPAQIAERLRATIRDEQGVTCAVGVAASVSVARLASRRAGSDGVLVVAPRDVSTFLHPLDVGELPGVGDKTRSALHRLGVRTVGDLAHLPLPTLGRAVGHGLAASLHALARGDDRRQLVVSRGSDEPEHSMGAQETFGHDVEDREVVLRTLLRLVDEVASRVRSAELAARTVAVTVRLADSTTLTRSRQLPEATDVTQEIYRAAVGLHDALGLPHVRFRTVGVRVEGLVSRAGVQHQLFLGEREHGWAEADRAVDLVARRFGSRVVGPASLLGRDHPAAPTGSFSTDRLVSRAAPA